MMPHYQSGPVTLYHGASEVVMQSFADSSIDAIVTDPPYELGFMDKGWDSSGIAYSVELWAEALRVLKPGGHLLAFGGSRTYHRMAVAIEDAGFELRDSIAWLYGSGFPKSLDVAKTVEKSGADPAPWQGWGTALKPAFEPIVVARKPLVGTVAANVLAFGTGALNIAAARVGNESTQRKRTANDLGIMNDDGWTPTPGVNGSEAGRWPANVVLDESQAAVLDAQAPKTGGSGKASGPSLTGSSTSVARGRFNGVESTPFYGGELGGASRFFPTFKYEAKAPTSERPVVDGVAHATVKPLALMRWLVRLVTPPGGVVLDPFAGSGTTLEAAVLEGFETIGIELGEEHLPLIRHRFAKPLAQGFDLGDIA